ncbi:hypothetical protein K2173_021204 [Erythroxylum novogranatense]|uniref:Axial regulator YABBY 2 n=1 Tax=Erythroxylum novogranatense TaxID=1862640 RepID=A0AAV8TQ45_9ROSI|nr:hypothetical protein K2173_021204 [Erythroxylum novogranatense]
MSLELASERVCYVHCNFCDSILAVSVPSTSWSTPVTVRCGSCANLLSVNMGTSLQNFPLQDPQKMHLDTGDLSGKESGSSSKCTKASALEAEEHQTLRMPPSRTLGKRQRIPSAYNTFIKEEIQRIKASNPDISHREAFSTAAKNWAHFPHIHFGLKLDNTKRAKLEKPFAEESPPKATGLYEINGTL